MKDCLNLLIHVAGLFSHFHIYFYHINSQKSALFKLFGLTNLCWHIGSLRNGRKIRQERNLYQPISTNDVDCTIRRFPWLLQKWFSKGSSFRIAFIIINGFKKSLQDLLAQKYWAQKYLQKCHKQRNVPVMDLVLLLQLGPCFLFWDTGQSLSIFP